MSVYISLAISIILTSIPALSLPGTCAPSLVIFMPCVVHVSTSEDLFGSEGLVLLCMSCMH